MQSNHHCMFHKYSAHVRQRYGYTNYAEHGPQRYEYTLYLMVHRDLNSQYMSAHMHAAQWGAWANKVTLMSLTYGRMHNVMASYPSRRCVVPQPSEFYHPTRALNGHLVTVTSVT